MMLPLSKPVARQPRKWTAAEDQKLREEVEAQRSEGEVKDWCRVAAKLPGRTNKDCRKRWLNSVAGGLKKGQWARGEDQQLARGVERFGQRWTLVAEVVGSRSADQCAKRWQQSLDPELDRSEWQESEDLVLIDAVQKLGRHWKDIQRQHFPGRSKNCIKNRYTVIIRRYQNSGTPLPEGVTPSEPRTPRERSFTHSSVEESPIPYSHSQCDEFLTPRTQVSTPETRYSWSLDDEPFSNWSSPESGAMLHTSISSNFPKYHQQQVQVSMMPQWSCWTSTAPAEQTSISMMNTMPTAAYMTSFAPQATPQYASYATIPGMIAQRIPPTSQGHGSSFYMRAPTSSPHMVNSAVYQGQESATKYMKYGVPNAAAYRY